MRRSDRRSDTASYDLQALLLQHEVAQFSTRQLGFTTRNGSTDFIAFHKDKRRWNVILLTARFFLQLFNKYNVINIIY